MATTKQRLVDGPDEDNLEKAEVATYLRLKVKTLDRLIQAGEFPQGVHMSDRTIVWPWRDVLYWQLRVELRPRLVQTPPTAARKKRGATEGHRAPTDTPQTTHRGTSGKRDSSDA